MKRHSRQLLIGQVIGQLALFLVIPVLTRLLSPHEMGIYQTGFSIAMILQPLATLRRELLIPFSGIQDARRHRGVGLGFAALCCSVAMVTALMAWVLGAPDLAETLVAGGLVLLAFAIMYVENAYLIRCGAHGRLAARNLGGGVLSALLQIVAALLVPSAIAIALALLIGRAVVTAVTAMRLPIVEQTSGRGERKKQRSISAILSAMIATGSSQALVIVSFGTLGPPAAAQIGIGQRIAGAPASLAGQALSQIALSSAAPLIRERQPGLTVQLRKQTVLTGCAALLTTVALMVGGPLLAVPILGPGWEMAGILTAVFAIPLSLTLVALPATTLLIPLGRERLLVVLQLIRLIAIVTALVATSAVTGDVITTCIVTAIVWTIAYVPLLAASFLSTAAHDRECSEGDPRPDSS